MALPADRAWLALAAGVTVYEIAAARRSWELLSEAADRHRTKHPWLVHAAVIYLGAHLLRRWPRNLDPLGLAARLVGR